LSPSARYRRRWLRRSFPVALLVLGLGLLTVGDRAGWFGQRRPGDLDRYHERTAYVVRVIDGDTLDVDIPDRDHATTRIRLWGVDTPETVKPEHPVEHFGPQASAFTRRAVLDKTVRLELQPHDTRDKYGRLLAYVYLPDGRMLNRLLVETGHAWADPRYEHRERTAFARLQKQARREKRGLWKDATPADLPYYLRDP
jgi:micrococcal nuclease